MKRIYTLILIIGLMAIGALEAQSQSLTSYLSDKTDTAVRVQVTQPEEARVENRSFASKILLFMSARRVPRVRPEIGTKFTVESSAYAPSPYQTNAQPCITAAGTRVRHGVVASNFLPFGTILEINGETFIVEDRMNPRYDGYFIDIWFPSTSSALQFGRQRLVIEVVGYGDPGQTIRETNEDESEDDDEEKAEIEDVREKENGDDEEEDEGLWSRIRSNIFSLGNLGSLLGIRSTVDVNRHDVNCFDESNT